MKVLCSSFEVVGIECIGMVMRVRRRHMRKGFGFGMFDDVEVVGGNMKFG